jgi:hypothetical protein
MKNRAARARALPAAPYLNFWSCEVVVAVVATVRVDVPAVVPVMTTEAGLKVNVGRF